MSNHVFTVKVPGMFNAMEFHKYLNQQGYCYKVKYDNPTMMWLFTIDEGEYGLDLKSDILGMAEMYALKIA